MSRQTDHHKDEPHIKLNSNSIKQAYKAKKNIINLNLTSVIHSPLKRAIETKDMLIGNLRLP